MKRELRNLTEENYREMDTWLFKMTKGYNSCPFDSILGCQRCRDIFPDYINRDSLGCPCDVYSKKYVKKVVKQILRQKRKGGRNEREGL